MLKFEMLQHDKERERLHPPFTLQRAKIPGGWLVVFYNQFSDVVYQSTYGLGYGGVTFIPDPNHTWDGSSIA